MPHSRGSTRWECSHRSITFGLHAHFVHCSSFFFVFGISISNNTYLRLNYFVDRRYTKPNLKLVNKVSLDKLLKAEIYVNEADGQLRVAHLILGYTPLSFAFQAPKCVIRARNPRLRPINVAYEGFIVPEDIPLPQHTSRIEPFFVASISAGTSSSQPTLREEGIGEREEEEQRQEEAIELSESSDNFGIFDQSIHWGKDPDEMGIQRKPQRSLLELMEGQPRKDALARSL